MCSEEHLILVDKIMPLFNFEGLLCLDYRGVNNFDFFNLDYNFKMKQI